MVHPTTAPAEPITGMDGMPFVLPGPPPRLSRWDRFWGWLLDKFVLQDR